MEMHFCSRCDSLGHSAESCSHFLGDRDVHRDPMGFLRGEFVPLQNFQPGDVNFRNTCFIAVVANLRHVLQLVMQAVRQYKWKDYINLVRTSWEGE